MGLGILHYWVSGKNCFNNKFKMDYILIKSQYSIAPLFHYSVIDAKTHGSK
jgi:hypothetical protein